MLARAALALVATAAVAVDSTASAAPPEQPHRPLVRVIARVAVGQKTLDQTVVRTFGAGCFVRQEGHGGGRYYTDLGRKVTLHTVIGVDWATDEVELSAFVDVPSGCRDSERTVSAALPAAPEIEHGLHFGMNPSEVIGILGRPDEDKLGKNARTLTYRATVETDPRVDLAYEAKFRFVGERLTKVSVYDGE